ncbi:DoxX family protein [Peribacillus aracenensis]|uniref:DoxX family protein n=1 Tax=Peribacillus aracenensis TaxID=2976708 RepID=UPI0021A4E267|nr:DoxX family protein [Peribacillus sp. BBB004]
MTILTWILQGLLALMFIMAGMGKTFGSNMHKEAFEQWRLPQWFRVVTGIVELTAAIFLIIGFWSTNFAIIGALIIVFTSIGGVITHLRVKDGFKETSTILFLGIIAIALLFILI